MNVDALVGVLKHNNKNKQWKVDFMIALVKVHPSYVKW